MNKTHCRRWPICFHKPMITTPLGWEKKRDICVQSTAASYHYCFLRLTRLADCWGKIIFPGYRTILTHKEVSVSFGTSENEWSVTTPARKCTAPAVPQQRLRQPKEPHPCTWPRVELLELALAVMLKYQEKKNIYNWWAERLSYTGRNKIRKIREEERERERKKV